MCTLIALFGLRPDYPLVLASNRDEFYARPTARPARLLEQPWTVGGRDLRAGGTWLGVTREGFFVGVTNYRGYLPSPPDARSRGSLVMTLLAAGNPTAARAQLEHEDARQYSEFNLLFGNATELWAAYGRSERAEIETKAVAPGLHLLPNGHLDSADFPKVQRARDLLEPHLSAPWPQLREALRTTLADDQTFPIAPPADAPNIFSDDMLRRLSALCVRTPSYGTCSSNVVALQPGRCAYFGYADGPPDVNGFEDLTELLQPSEL